MKISTVQETKIDNAKTGASIRKLRLKKKTSLRELAVAMQISAPFLSDLERGHRAWSEERFAQAVKLLQ